MKDLTNPEEVIETVVFQLDKLDAESLKLFADANYPLRCGSCGIEQVDENCLELIQVTAVVLLNYHDGEKQNQIPIPWKILYCKNCLANLFVHEKGADIMYQ